MEKKNVDSRTNCDICGIAIDPKESHNAEPVVEGGRCCTECNNKVIAARLAQAMGASIKFNNKKRNENNNNIISN